MKRKSSYTHKVTRGRRRAAAAPRARRQVRRNPLPYQSIRFAVGRPRGSRTEAIQAVMFSTREWSQAEAREWLHSNGFKFAAVDKDLGWWVARQRDASEFESKGLKLRAIDIGTRREKITVASNPSRRRRRRKVKGSRRRRSSARPAAVRPRRRRRPARRVRARRARSRGKTTRTTMKSTKVVRTNPKKKSRVRRRRRTRASRSRFTLAFPPGAARLFSRVARLSKARKREMRRALRRHPSGGVFVNLAGWHGSRAAAMRFAARVKALLGVAAARRRLTIAAPRVVAVP